MLQIRSWKEVKHNIQQSWIIWVSETVQVLSFGCLFVCLLFLMVALVFFLTVQILQGWLPNAHVVKCWNTVGAELMIGLFSLISFSLIVFIFLLFVTDPKLPDTPTMPICGNNDEAKTTVKEVLRQCGWDATDLGVKFFLFIFNFIFISSNTKQKQKKRMQKWDMLLKLWLLRG
jgi:hypothetical protein